MAARRGFLLGGLALAALPGCGFRPLLYRADGDNIRDELASVEVTGLRGRLGQQLQVALEDDLNPTSLALPERYQLDVRLRRSNSALAIQLDNTITRYNLTLIATFWLKDAEDARVIYNSSTRRVASYNVRRAPFATLTAQKDAERRAAEDIAHDIRTLLALHFQRQAPVV